MDLVMKEMRGGAMPPRIFGLEPPLAVRLLYTHRWRISPKRLIRNLGLRYKPQSDIKETHTPKST